MGILNYIIESFLMYKMKQELDNDPKYQKFDKDIAELTKDIEKLKSEKAELVRKWEAKYGKQEK